MNQLLLTEAAFRGDLNEVRKLIDEGYDIDLASDNGAVKRTALDNAIENEQLEIIRFLLKQGAHVNYASEFGTPLHHALDLEVDQFVWFDDAGNPQFPSAEITRLLVEFGADVNQQSQGQTPLEFAVQFRHVNAANILRQYGAIDA